MGCILVVEDDSASRLLVTRLLRRLGHQVVVAASGPEALDAAAPGIDLILTDLDLPGFGGDELARRLRSTGSLTPIVAVTADCDAELRAACASAGIDETRTKPLSMASLSELVARWVAGHPSVSPSEGSRRWGWAESGSDAAVDHTRLRHLVADAGEASPDIIVLFLAQLPARIDAIRVAATMGDAAAVSHTTHALLGPAELVGATELARCCRLLSAEASAGAVRSLGALDEAGRGAAVALERYAAVGGSKR